MHPTLPEIKQHVRARPTRKLTTSLTLHSLGQGASFFNARLCSTVRWVYGPHELNLVQNPILEQIFLQMVIFQPPAPQLHFLPNSAGPVRLASSEVPRWLATLYPAPLLNSCIVSPNSIIDSRRSPSSTIPSTANRDSFASFPICMPVFDLST